MGPEAEQSQSIEESKEQQITRLYHEAFVAAWEQLSPEEQAEFRSRFSPEAAEILFEGLDQPDVTEDGSKIGEVGRKAAQAHYDAVDSHRRNIAVRRSERRRQSGRGARRRRRRLR